MWTQITYLFYYSKDVGKIIAVIIFLCFEIHSHYIIQAGFELTIFLAPPLWFWDLGVCSHSLQFESSSHSPLYPCCIAPLSLLPDVVNHSPSVNDTAQTASQIDELFMFQIRTEHPAVGWKLIIVLHEEMIKKQSLTDIKSYLKFCLCDYDNLYTYSLSIRPELSLLITQITQEDLLVLRATHRRDVRTL